MLNIALCDDNVPFMESTASAINEILDSEQLSSVITKFTSGEQLLKSPPFDIIFLDMEMDGIDGIETACRLRQRGDTVALIFLTAYRQYVFSAFDVQASHYLVKPLDPVKLREVLLRIAQKFLQESQESLLVKQGGDLCRVQLQEILFIEVFGRKISIHTAQGKYDFYGKLDQLEETLPNAFFRCHRSFIVNLRHVKKYGKTETLLEDGQTVPIAKRKAQAFGKAFLMFLRQEGEGL